MVHAEKGLTDAGLFQPLIVACTSVSGHSSMLWPCTSAEEAPTRADASAGRAGLVGVPPVVLNGDRYGLLNKLSAGYIGGYIGG